MRRFAIAALCLISAGCVSTPDMPLSPSATQQILPSHALIEALRGVNLRLQRGSKVYVDTTAIRDLSLADLIRQHFEGEGLLLEPDAAADIDIEVAMPVYGIDQIDRVLGFPATTIPSVHAGVPSIGIPEIAAASRHEKIGIAELHISAVDAHTRKLITAVGPVSGTARIVDTHILTGFVFGDVLAPPAVRAARQ